MKLKQLESHLSEVDVFESPKIQFEQYPTGAHIASRMLYTAEHTFRDISSKYCIDLGCGTGMLSIAAVMMGAGHVLGIDIDPDALVVAQRNVRAILFGEDEGSCGASDGASDSDEPEDTEPEDAEPEDAEPEDAEPIPSIDLVRMDVTGLHRMPSLHKIADTVLTNPPFGTKGNKGIDIEFLRAAFHMSRGAVYSLHKTSTRAYIGKWAKNNGAVNAEPIVALRYDLPKSYDFHTKKAVDVEVDIWRFEVGAGD